MMKREGRTMKNIADIIETVADETGLVPRLSVLYVMEGEGPNGDEDAYWVAKIVEDGMTLLDREGDRFLSCKADTLEEAMAGLEKLCA
jgi:hypothetical protein